MHRFEWHMATMTDMKHENDNLKLEVQFARADNEFYRAENEKLKARNEKIKEENKMIINSIKLDLGFYQRMCAKLEEEIEHSKRSTKAEIDYLKQQNEKLLNLTMIVKCNQRPLLAEESIIQEKIIDVPFESTFVGDESES